jgi:phage terminase large subunit-like protein
MPAALDVLLAERERRERQVRRELGPRYDWYGGPCPCGVPLGDCEAHHRARPAQRPPGSYLSASGRDDWRIWWVNAGRGFGKTRSGAEYVRGEVEAGRASLIGLVGDTIKDVRTVMIEGPAGLQSVFPPWWTVLYEPSKATVTFSEGGTVRAVATIYSAEDPGGLRGPQFHLLWADEPAKWEHSAEDVWDNIEFCLRMKSIPRPRVVVTTTPRPTDLVDQLMADPRTAVTGGSTFENAAHLDPDFIARMRQKYEGTRIGDQELYAIVARDVPGALWTREMVERAYVPALPPGVTLRRIVVAVDPNAGSQDPEKAAETGIVVVAKGSDGYGYVLADDSTKGSPDTWGRATVRSYRSHEADRVAGEKNNGGDMVEHTLRTIDPNIPYTPVWASRGKRARAEPVAALYEQNKIRHVGRFPELERQMARYNPDDPAMGLKDRVDALVWGLTLVMLGPSQSGLVAVGGRRSPPRRP